VQQSESISPKEFSAHSVRPLALMVAAGVIQLHLLLQEVLTRRFGGSLQLASPDAFVRIDRHHGAIDRELTRVL
jgi:hypothetical protein